jgi:hypothetical protein
MPILLFNYSLFILYPKKIQNKYFKQYIFLDKI